MHKIYHTSLKLYGRSRQKKEYRCVQCGLEVTIFVPEEVDLFAAECENCGIKTLREVTVLL
jgi:DNA-directed RNA polymerase subunit RPC12/RpoP